MDFKTFPSMRDDRVFENFPDLREKGKYNRNSKLKVIDTGLRGVSKSEGQKGSQERFLIVGSRSRPTASYKKDLVCA